MENKVYQNGNSPTPQPYPTPQPTGPGTAPVGGPDTGGPSYSFSNEPKGKLPTGAPTDPKTRESLKSIISTISILILAPILAILITSFLFQSYQVDGPSMQNTLHNSDRLVVLKAGKTWANLTHRTYMPPRGAIVVFESPEATEDKQLIKRVIGLPGDHIIVKDGEVTVTNQEHPEGYNPDTGAKWSQTANNSTSPGNVDVTVSDGEIFVMGDNRTNSLDSRIFGPIKTSSIAGKLVFRVFPFNKAQGF